MNSFPLSITMDAATTKAVAEKAPLLGFNNDHLQQAVQELSNPQNGLKARFKYDPETDILEIQYKTNPTGEQFIPVIIISSSNISVKDKKDRFLFTKDIAHIRSFLAELKSRAESQRAPQYVKLAHQLITTARNMAEAERKKAATC